MNAGARVLAIDDSPEALALLVELLSAEGYQVRPADSGELALVAAEAQPPDLILLDLRLTGMSGLEVCRRLKESKRTQQIPVILMSAFAEVNEWVEGMKLGAADYITKPFQPVELLTRLRTHLIFRQAQQSLEQQVQALRQSKEHLESEIARRETVEAELRVALDRDRRSRVAMLSALEDWKLSRDRALTHARQQLVIAELSQFALRQEEFTALADRAVRMLTAVMEVDFAEVMELQPDGSALVMAAGSGYEQELLGHASVGVGTESQAGFTLSSKEPVIVENFATDQRFKTPALATDHAIVSGICVIIGNPCQPYGVLGIHSSQIRSYGPNDIHCLQGMAAVLTGAWQRKTAESEQRLLTTAIEQANEAILITDPAGIIQYVNPAFEIITGYSRQEVLGKNPRILKSGQQDAEFYRLLWATISGGQTWQGVLVNKRKDGSFFTERATISPVRDAGGKLLNYVAIAGDITARLRAQEEKALLEDQLRQAQRVESMGKLAGGIAHDFNNMLNVIIGCSEIVLSELDFDNPLRSRVNEIVKAAQHSASLTRQLLAFSRQQALQPLVLDVNPAVSSIGKLLQQVIGENIELSLQLSSEPLMVKADPSQLEQVIMNLALNARDAMPEGGKLTIVTARLPADNHGTGKHAGLPPGDYVLVSVTDTGCGMDRQTLSRIFEPFFTTKEKGKGIGLGLSTVYGIVSQSGGTIRAYSEPGQGSTFEICLPATSERCNIEQQRSVDSSSNADAPEDWLRGEWQQILVVEDEEAVRQLLETSLSGLGYHVRVATNAAEALALFEEGLKFDLVISDIVMPGISGTALSGILHGKQPGLKILLMSGYTENAAEIGETPFIQKPFSTHSLSLKVHEILRGLQPRKELILVVDDHPINTEVAVLLLKDFGFESHTAADGRQALAALERSSYSLVLMDILMPGMDGYSALDSIRKKEASGGSHLPVIAMTAQTADGRNEDCLARGMDDCISKPLNHTELLRILRKWLPVGSSAPAGIKSSRQAELEEPGEEPAGDRKLEPEALLDLAAIETQYGRANTPKLLAIFERDVIKHLAELQQAVGSKNAETVCITAHGLKGVFKTMFAEGLSQLCLAVENASREKEWPTILSLTQELEQKFENIQCLLHETK
jgi:PAS domain S-box-containing protein